MSSTSNDGTKAKEAADTFDDTDSDSEGPIEKHHIAAKLAEAAVGPEVPSSPSPRSRINSRVKHDFVKGFFKTTEKYEVHVSKNMEDEQFMHIPRLFKTVLISKLLVFMLKVALVITPMERVANRAKGRGPNGPTSQQTASTIYLCYRSPLQ